MIRDIYGRIEFSSSDIIKILYQYPEIDTVNLPLSKQDLEKYKNACIQLNIQSKFRSLSDIDISVEDFDTQNQNDWFIPKEYLEIDIEQWLYDQCQNDFQLNRVKEELDLYKQMNFVFLLKISKYLVDSFRKNQIVWGVGRGSSVSSYCLYLIGLHKIDSLKYNLDIKEFLK
jgi:DNA polymerase III alpha subunit